MSTDVTLPEVFALEEQIENFKWTITQLELRISDLTAANEKFTQERDEWRISALIDVMTGLPNRRALMERLEAVAVQPVVFALLLVDLRDLKGINHTHGMDVADQVLKHVARILLTSLRTADNTFVARMGGDEFAVLIGTESADLGTVQAIAQRLYDKTLGRYRRRDTGEYIQVKVSIGGSLTQGSTPAETIYGQVARNLEAAKEIAYLRGDATRLPIVITT